MEGPSGSVEKDAIAREFLKSVCVLIVDQNSSARVGLKKLLVSLGTPLHHIFLANSYEEAEESLKKNRPSLVFCDYKIGGRFGLDLLQKQREEFPQQMNQSLFILVTSNTSQSAVAQAAEDDVDAFILKPYTVESFTVSLTRAIQIKVHPSEYLRLINKGKLLLEKNQIDDAKAIFELAITKDAKPSLACFYEGFAYFKKSLLEGSESSYHKGLSFNKIHYKCLVGLFDLLLSLKRYDGAYEIVRKIVRFFPANPKRLSTVLRLAIQTKHYADVEVFYNEFLKLDERTDDLVRCVCAALIVCGKHFFELSDKKTGLDLLRKASVSAAGNPPLLRKVVETLISQDEVLEAKEVLKRFELPTDEDSNYAVSTLLVASKELPPELAASRGQELLGKGINDIEVYRVTIHCLSKYGKKDRAEELLQDAVKLYPELGHELKQAA